jgi:nucleotide-binding universal stress UspA family protein
MTFKDILVYADDNKSAAAYLDFAIGFAATYQAHLTALHVMAPPFVPADITGGTAAVQIFEWQQEFTQQRAAAAKKTVAAAEKRSGRDIEWRCVDGDPLDTAILHARYADMTIVAQRDGDTTAPISDLAETVFLEAGRPVLTVPAYGKFVSAGDRVLIAWNGSREATRAVHDALPILTRAKAVTILEINPTEGLQPRIPGADIAVHLARHGINTQAAATTASDISVGDTLLSRAADLGADLLVMGGYGHSRLREFAFGGATKHLLNHMTLPVFMSH